MRRAKPLLGTLVSIDVDGVDEARFIEASDRAFARVAAIHAAMSFHEAGSDLRAMARARTGDTLPLHAETCAVLQLALAFETQSGGAFNACCAATLVARSLLPAPDDASPPQASTLAEAIELLPDDRVRVLRPAWIDLGGIAKGYAVDQAVLAMRRAGCASGWVNAGGDLRVFGEAALETVAGPFGVHIGGSAPDTTAPTAVVSPQETSPADRPAPIRDSNTMELARSPSRRQAARYGSSESRPRYVLTVSASTTARSSPRRSR